LAFLGTLGFFLFWILAASGSYLYLRFDTSIAGAYDSIGELEWWFGGLLRSMHRYAADAFVVVVLAHLVRELLAGRFRGFRAFSWISGVPLLWLMYASGIVGYWLVWDTRAQFSALATLEWLGMADAGAELVSDRLFSLFVFLHIGLPLALLAGMWIHVQRLNRPRTVLPRALAMQTIILLLGLSLILPATSGPRWDAARLAQTVAVDWFYQFAHPLMYAISAPALWVLVLGGTALLVALPYLAKKESLVPAQVDPANCNGCGRCVADCPYEAITLSAAKASVLAERCAGCGICAGACPSSTPFRSAAELRSGIDLPDLTVHALRRQLQQALPAEEIVFACERSTLGAGLGLRCLAMLPPAFIEYALRNGARRVTARGCDAQCAFRLGLELADERFSRRREPRLRGNVVASRHDNEYSFVLR
jgi:quinol-cytochrome oxidoreductase complex cytochrome b subunit